MKSQIKPSKEITNLVSCLKDEKENFDILVKLRDVLHKNIKIIPYTKETEKAEREIRWKRTASEIVSDGYVYKGKACTDIVIVFLSFCKTLGLKANFLKFKKLNMVHSMSEVKVNKKWFIFDVANKNSLPQIEKKQITSGEDFDGWILWKKGKDAWDIGLDNFESKNKINI